MDVLNPFVSLMERLQDKVEDTPVASQAVVKVVSAVAAFMAKNSGVAGLDKVCLLYTSPSPRDS